MTPFVQSVTTLLAVGTIAMQILAVLLICGLLIKKEELIANKGLGKLMNFISKYVLELGLLVSLGAVLSSMFYSNVAGFPPCEFCWWQRIMIYPQAILFAVAIYNRRKGGNDSIATSTSLILSIIGAALGLFQYYGAMFNPGLLEACVATGPSCAANYFTAFGYITIPLMSLTCFALLILIVVAHKRVVKIA